MSPSPFAGENEAVIGYAKARPCNELGHSLILIYLTNYHYNKFPIHNTIN